MILAAERFSPQTNYVNIQLLELMFIWVNKSLLLGFLHEQWSHTRITACFHPFFFLWFFSFILLKWWITFIDFWTSNPPWIPRINPLWLWILSFLYIAGFDLKTFYLAFLCLCSWTVLFCNCPFLQYPCHGLVSTLFWSHKESRSFYSFFGFSNHVLYLCYF